MLEQDSSLAVPGQAGTLDFICPFVPCQALLLNEFNPLVDGLRRTQAHNEKMIEWHVAEYVIEIMWNCHGRYLDGLYTCVLGYEMLVVNDCRGEKRHTGTKMRKRRERGPS
jgi:hypothetical protein